MSTHPLSTVPTKIHHHFAEAVKVDPAAIKKAMGEVHGFNAKLAVLITKGVGSMACAYLFCLIALVSLPAIISQTGWVPKTDIPTFLRSPGLILIVAWVAQTFIQLVLLAVIMVGQAVQSAASDARAEETATNTEKLVAGLDISNSEQLAQILAAIKGANDA